ncbi:hypothetical protein GCM10028857_18810 [Salinarchaeum chitinilyticum]
MIRHLWGRLGKTVRGSTDRAIRLPIDDPIHTRPADVPGQLLRVYPYADNDGLSAGAAFLRSISAPTTSRLGRNVSDHHAFELWFHEGTLSFYLHAADETAGSDFRRRLANAYPESEVHAVTGGDAFPTVRPSSYVAGARIDTRRHYFFPIRNLDADEFDSDPFEQLTNEMRSTDDTSVVFQVVFRPAKRSWATGSRFRRNGVRDIARSKRRAQSVGFLDPHTEEPTEEDERLAARLERQADRVAFHANLRVLVISADQTEANRRLVGIEEAFETQYESTARQGLTASPITHWRQRTQAKRLRSFLERSIDRRWVNRECCLTVHELAGLAHFPNEEIGTPDVDWRHTARGEWIPNDLEQHERSRGTSDDPAPQTAAPSGGE